MKQGLNSTASDYPQVMKQRLMDSMKAQKLSKSTRLNPDQGLVDSALRCQNGWKTCLIKPSHRLCLVLSRLESLFQIAGNFKIMNGTSTAMKLRYVVQRLRAPHGFRILSGLIMLLLLRPRVFVETASLGLTLTFPTTWPILSLLMPN